MPTDDKHPTTKAEAAAPAAQAAERAAMRIARRAKQEAEALRLNLLKRKAQSRARDAAKPEDSNSCR